MDMLQNKSPDEILRSLLAEIAKSSAELRCARADLQKVGHRLTFALVAVNELLDREIPE